MAEKMDIPKWLHAGVYLHTSCNDEWWGPVTRVGEDPNGRQVVDFQFPTGQLTEFLTTDPGEVNLCEVIVPDGTCIMRDVPIVRLDEYGPELDGARFLELDTPGNGCVRCTKLFRVYESRGW